MLKGPPRELAGFCQSQPRQPPQRRQNASHHRPPAMHVQLNHIFARETFGRRKPQHQRIVQRCAVIRIDKPHPRGKTRSRYNSSQRLQGSTSTRSRQPDERDPSPVLPARQRKNSIRLSTHQTPVLPMHVKQKTAAPQSRRQILIRKPPNLKPISSRRPCSSSRRIRRWSWSPSGGQ